MREPKFRAWNKRINVMSEPFGLYHVEPGCYPKYLGFPLEDSRYLVDMWNEDETKDIRIMQYTGLKDKNGKEIYEGDILRFIDNSLGIVIYQAPCYGIDWGSGNEQFLGIDYDKVTIIGNIYENPEFLKREVSHDKG